jgi:hypothetical protein
MLKYLFSFLLPVILSFTIKAQKHSFEYGLTGGVTINSASGSGVDLTKKSNFYGFSLGGQMKLNTSSQFGVRIIIEYAQLGWKFPSLTFADSVFLHPGSATFKMNYLNLPVMAEYSFGKKLKYHLDAGLFLGLLINNQIVIKLADTYPSNAGNTSFSSDSRNTFNYGFAGGMGVELPIRKNNSIHLNLRDMAGLANVNKLTGSTGTKIFLNSLSATAGITWRIK